MNLFGLYRHLWPIQRRLVKLTPRCPRCILQSNGICEECMSYKPEPEPSPQVLKMPDSVVVMMSGGKDSAYTLHRLVTEYPNVRVMAITVDSGFIDQGVDNAIYCCAKLRVDHVVVNSHLRDFRERYRAALADYKDAYHTFDHADGSLIFQIAQAYTDKPLVSGISREQARMIVKTDSHEHNGCIFPMVVWNPSEEEIYRTVRQHGLLPKGKEHVGVTNNRLLPTLCALDVKRNGFCSFEPEFARLVRKGKADRQEWLTTFELLEWSAKKGWFDGQIKAMMLELGVPDIARQTTIPNQPN